MKEIELKILPQFFRPVKEGKKTFEVRQNDRNFEEGDIIRLREFLPYTEKYTGREFRCIITYVLTDERFVKKGYCIFSFLPL